jgi:hypothetical protein
MDGPDREGENATGREMRKFGIVMEYLRFLREEKKYWMIPMVIVLLLLGLMVTLFEGSVVAPFIYTLF